MGGCGLVYKAISRFSTFQRLSKHSSTVLSVHMANCGCSRAWQTSRTIGTAVIVGLILIVVSFSGQHCKYMQN